MLYPPVFLLLAGLLLLPGAFGSVLIDQDRWLASDDRSLEEQEIVVDKARLTVAGSHRFASLRLVGGAVLTHEPAAGGEVDHAIRLTIAGDLRIDAASRIEVSGLGYGILMAPGAGTHGAWSGGGGGHGGDGGSGNGDPPGQGGQGFGSILAPDEWGGPGAHGSDLAVAPGGGLVRLEIGGEAVIDGLIRADGKAGVINNQGGGAGGSVFLAAGTLRGSGEISASGAPGEWIDGGGGGGGRIALVAGTDLFTGRVRAPGAGGATWGGGGTVFRQVSGKTGELTVSNEGRGGWTPLSTPVAFHLVVATNGLAYFPEAARVASLTVREGGTLSHRTGAEALVLQVTGDATLERTAAISVDGRGHPVATNAGPGAGVRRDWAGSGGSHGGRGGHSRTGSDGGTPYGSIRLPVAWGSQGGGGDGGAGGAGGGSVRITVDGRLQVRGRISADGLPGAANNSGGGSGGSLVVTAGVLSGDGVLSANGGAGEWIDGGGGSGGRIAIQGEVNEFTGTIACQGGGGFERGGAGTFFARWGTDTAGAVLADNGGQLGNYTPIRAEGLTESFDLAVAGKAQANADGELVVRQLEVRPDGILAHPPAEGSLAVRVLGDARVQKGGRILADGRGYPVSTNRGPGTGIRLSWSGSGGGHGGQGGRSTTGGSGGDAYGSITEPVAWGSQGGDADGGAGAAGGGAIRLIVQGGLTVDGEISANGAPGTLNNTGGGAGGSVYLALGSLSGTGLISANGGVGEWIDGGGGAGGRIAVHGGDGAFAGRITAWGGGGAERGAAGTIYTRPSGSPAGRVHFDNGDQLGAHTPYAWPDPLDVVIAGKAQVYPSGAVTMRTLNILTNGILTHPAGEPRCEINVIEDARVHLGGNLSATGRGYPRDLDRGPGAGARREWAGAGGGHGGEGGGSVTGAAGGAAYGSVAEPDTAGSQGGDADGGGGAAGGGVIRLRVDGRLMVDGLISADGLGPEGRNNVGGGAGGSVFLTVGQLEGRGGITARGGLGEWLEGGGGAGGRIAIHYGVNRFEGLLLAHGASGSQRGGAGTIYTCAVGSPRGQVWISNGDGRGAHTPFAWPEPIDLTIGGLAQVYPQGVLLLHRLDVLTNGILTHLPGADRCDVVVLTDAVIRPQGAISVDGRGYPQAGNPGPGSGDRRDWAGSGAGHGGRGGASTTKIPGGAPYGSRLAPRSLGSQGGGGSGGIGGAGGGALRFLVGGALRVDGQLTANGLPGTFDNSGGGSGGSLFLVARNLVGEGRIAADGGNGEWLDGGGGAGGRIALHRGGGAFGGTLSVRGGGGAARGGDGTVVEDSVPGLLWLAPGEDWLFGTVPVEVAALSAPPTGSTLELSRAQGESWHSLGSAPLRGLASLPWDTTRVADGYYQLRALVRDEDGRIIAEGRKAVGINNSVLWQAGVMGVSETWVAGQVHAVKGDLIIPAGITLRVEPGTIVKFLPGSRFVIRDGGNLTIPGSGGAPVVWTAFADDTVGGDSNLDGNASTPAAGTWRLQRNAGGQILGAENALWRFHSQAHGGRLAGSETWNAEALREVTETVVVPAGATLRIEAGTIVKFAPGSGLDVQSGAGLEVAGTVSQPVVLTSIRDESYGGDSQGDGATSGPAAGDWRSVRLIDGAHGTLDHAVIRFGGNSVGNPWGAGGAIESLGGPLTVRNSIISESLKDGAFCQGSTTFENCLVLRCDRGLVAVGDMQVLHATVDECRIGLLEHGGHLVVRNSIVSRSLDAGIEHDLGPAIATVSHCNVWNPTARRGNYRGLTDRTGTDGNLSAEPHYKDPDHGNFRLNYASPGIDAADGTWSAATDFSGAPRYDDPRTGNTGAPDEEGSFPDLGALEFVENAPSRIDLVIGDVRGPSELTAGDLVRLEWTVVNRGTEPLAGPWHDAVYLQSADGGERLRVAEPLVGSGVILGPGQAQRVETRVRVPGGLETRYQWVIVGNSRSDLFEGANADNNEGTSLSSSLLSLPELQVDGPAVSAAFGANGESHWFRCRAPAGKDVRVELDLGSEVGITELYVGRGFLPTPERFSARQREFGSADTSAVASGVADPGTETGEIDFYVLAVGRVLGTIPSAFSVKSVSASLVVDRVVPDLVGNAGPVTLDLQGAALGAGTSFLLRSGFVDRPAIRTSQREDGRAFATFELNGFPAGPADLVARRDGLDVVRPAALQVVEGGVGEFHAALQGPGVSRAGRTTTWFVTYGNRGLIDVQLPLLTVSAPGASEIRLFDHTANWTHALVLLALHPDVLLPTLGPGQETTVEIEIKTFVPTRVSLGVLNGEAFRTSEIPLQWSSRPRPEGTDPSRWNALLGELPGRLGRHLGEYAAVLERDLDELRGSRLRYEYLANVNGRWLAGDEIEGPEESWPIIDISAEEEREANAAELARHEPPARLPGDGIRRTWFVVITMEDYADRRAEGRTTRNTPAAGTDYADIREYLNRDLRLPPEQLVGGHDAPGDAAVWSRANILDTLSSFRGRADADDNLVVIYSGHGGRGRAGTGYLVPNGGPGITPTAFAREIDRVGAGTTYFINNSCHSEAFNELVHTTNTRFVGYAATRRDRLAFGSVARGSPMIAYLKGQLRKCRSLGMAFDITEVMVAQRFRGRTNETQRQHPILTNPSQAGLEGKPWNDPAGLEQELERAFDEVDAAEWTAVELDVIGSVDPNDKYALAGAGPERWVQAGQRLPFEVVFENKTNAAAPAQEVVVVDDLDPRLDWSSFELNAIAFNDVRLIVPAGRQRFSTTTPVGTDPHEVVVDVDFNPATGRITWKLRSRDSATGDLPEDPYAGFLPPNDLAHRGEGSLTYTVRAQSDLADGTVLTNQATIYFDPTYGANPPIATPWVTNRVDSVFPTSLVAPLPAQSTGVVPVRWSGEDSPGGSGLASYDLYVQRDHGPFVPWQIATLATSADFTGVPGSTYRFYSVARDAAGNRESPPSTPDAVTTIAGGSGFATWAGLNGLPSNHSGPADDPDGDGLPNFAEYAFGLNPLANDALAARPTADRVVVGNRTYLALTYRRPRLEPADVRYEVTWSPQAHPWTGIASVLAGDLIVDRVTHVEVTVRSTEPIEGGTQGYLRLRVQR